MKIIGDLLNERWSTLVIMLLVATIAAVCWFFYQTRVIWGYFLISVAVAYLLGGMVNKLESRGIPRTGSVGIAFTLVLGILAVLLIILIPKLADRINDFVKELPEYVSLAQLRFESFSTWLNASDLPDDVKSLPDRFWEGFQDYTGTILQKGINSIVSIFGGFYAIIIIPLATFYLLKDVHKFRDSFLKLFSPSNRNTVEGLLAQIDRAFGGFIRSRLKLCLIVGVGMVVGLSVFKVPYPVVLGLIAGVCEFVPYVGPIIGAVPALIVGLITPEKFLPVLVIVLIVQVLENAIFVPRVMGTEMGLHPLVVIMALLAGGQLAGAGGMVISVPLVAAVKIIAEFFIARSAELQPASNVDSGDEGSDVSSGETGDNSSGEV